MIAKCIPLPMADSGRVFELVEITGGRELTQRMADLGLSPGSRLKLVKSGVHGPLLIDVKDARLGLGVGAAQKIIVKEVSDE